MSVGVDSHIFAFPLSTPHPLITTKTIRKKKLAVVIDCFFRLVKKLTNKK